MQSTIIMHYRGESKSMERGKVTAIITGAISLLLAIAYLILVQILDFRGEMKPAPMLQIPMQQVIQLPISPKNLL